MTTRTESRSVLQENARSEWQVAPRRTTQVKCFDDCGFGAWVVCLQVPDSEAPAQNKDVTGP